MRKILMSVTALVLFLFVSTAAVNAADAPAACTDTQKTLVFHYMRFDQNYDNVGLHLWDTAGTSDQVTKSGVDDFGAYINICIGAKTAGTDGKYMIGSIPLYDLSASNIWDTKDTLNDGDQNLPIDVTYLFTPTTEGGTDTPDEMHVYFVQGSDSYVFPDPAFNNILVFYADSESKYDGWGIHTWDTGTDGSAPGWSDPLTSSDTGYTDKKFAVQLFVVKVADDAKAEVGFIMHKGDTKSYTENIMLSTTNVKANGTEVLYYLYGGEAMTTKDNFTTEVATYLPEPFAFKAMYNDEKTGALKGSFAPDPGIIRVEFNQDIKIKNGDAVVFDPEFFTLKQGETEIEITVDYLPNKDSVTEFVISFADENAKLDPTKAYTLSFDNGAEGLDAQVAEMAVDMDTEKPTITVVGGTEIEINQYDEFEFPDFVARDNRDGVITNKVYVPTTKGNLDTAKAEDQVITLAVMDDWGYLTELNITVKVKPAPVAEVESNNTGLIIGIIVGVVALAGAAGVVVLRKKA